MNTQPTTGFDHRQQILGAVVICLSAIAWGLDGVVLTPRLSHLPVGFVVFLLHAVPFLIMLPLLRRSWRALLAMEPRGWWVLALVAATGGLIGTLAIVKALFLVNFQRLSVVVLLQKLQPLFAITLASILLKERITARFVGLAVIAMAGAYLLTFGLAAPDLGSGDNTAQAALLALVAAAAFGSATVFGKQLLGSLDFADATFGRYGMTALMALAYVVVSGTGLPFESVGTRGWVIILVISVTTGSGAIFLYYFGLTRVRASVAAICELCLPLSAVFFDYVVNGSRLGLWQWLGAALLISAILRITTGRQSK
jgi:drug/metabolite transporter (DMT)-like permease